MENTYVIHNLELYADHYVHHNKDLPFHPTIFHDDSDGAGDICMGSDKAMGVSVSTDDDDLLCVRGGVLLYVDAV